MSKERPLCRKMILKKKLIPVSFSGEWSKYQAVNEEGKRVHLSDGMGKQMARMIADGTLEIIDYKQDEED